MDELNKENNGFEPVPEEETVSGGDMPEEETTENTNQPEDIQAETSIELDGGIPITPEEENADPVSEEELCILCGEKPADKSFGENYDLCADCRKSLIKSPLRFSGFLAVLTLFCVSVWGFMFLIGQSNTLMSVMQGDEQFASNHLYQAVASYSQAGNAGWKTGKRMVEAYNKSGYLSGINSTVSTYFYDVNALEEGQKLTFADKAGKSNLNAFWNKDVKAISDEYNAAMKSYQTYYEYIGKYDEQLYYGEITPEEIPFDEVIAKFEAAKAEATAKNDLAFINYCEYYLAYLCGKDSQTQYKYLQEVEVIAPDYGWLYRTPLTELQIAVGDYDKALENCEAIEKANADDVYGEYYRAQIFRMQGDYTAALEKSEELIAGYETSGFYYAYYEGAINAFLLGDYDKAFEYSEFCYNGEYLNEQTANFHALVCKKLGDEAGYEAVVEMLEGYELKISPTIEKYFSGEITAEEMFNESEVAFE